MPEQLYTVGEAVALLDIDRVTLSDWLQKEHMTARPDPRDGRSKLLTRDQLLELARVHNKSIRDETSIGPRLTGVQRDLVKRTQQVEEMLAAHMAQVNGMEEALTVHIAQLNELIRTVARLEARQTASAPQEVSEYPQPVERTYTPVPWRPRQPLPYHGERLKAGEWSTLPDVPEDWIPPRKFAQQLGVPERSFLHYLRPRYEGDKERYGHLDYHAGRWRGSWPGTIATALLDPEQQEAARAWFETKPSGDSTES